MPPSHIYCSSGLSDHSHRAQKGKHSPTTAFLSVAIGISTHGFLVCFSFPVIFLCCNILYPSHTASLLRLYILLSHSSEAGSAVSHWFSSLHQVSETPVSGLSFGPGIWVLPLKSLATPQNLVSLSLLRCLMLHLPNLCHCVLSILSFSRIVIVLFICLIFFSEVNWTSALSILQITLIQTKYSSILVSFSLLLVEMFL